MVDKATWSNIQQRSICLWVCDILMFLGRQEFNPSWRHQPEHLGCLPFTPGCGGETQDTSVPVYVPMEPVEVGKTLLHHRKEY